MIQFNSKTWTYTVKWKEITDKLLLSVIEQWNAIKTSFMRKEITNEQYKKLSNYIDSMKDLLINY